MRENMIISKQKYRAISYMRTVSIEVFAKF